MSPGRTLLLSLTLVTVAASDSAVAHPGGGTGYAARTIDRGSVPYGLLVGVGLFVERAFL